MTSETTNCQHVFNKNNHEVIKLVCVKCGGWTNENPSKTTNRRNSMGVKDSSDQYRTINGEHYICWEFDFTDAMVARYRLAGIKVRVIKGEMYIRSVDTEKAKGL